MRALLNALLLLAGLLLGAISHERDIYRSLTRDGDAGSSAWTCDIVSQEMKE